MSNRKQSVGKPREFQFDESTNILSSIAYFLIPYLSSNIGHGVQNCWTIVLFYRYSRTDTQAIYGAHGYKSSRCKILSRICT